MHDDWALRCTWQASWAGLSGHIDGEKIKAHCPAPSVATKVFVCGVPAMYEQLCGPRSDKELAPGSALAELGYTTDMVEKF